MTEFSARQLSDTTTVNCYTCQMHLNVMETKFVSFSLFYAIAIVFQLHQCNVMLYEMGRRKSDPTLLLTQGIFNLPHHMV